MPGLLQIPRSVRARIWAFVILHSVQSNVQILLVSAQVFQETLPFMYRRPLAFESQSDLYAWLERVDMANLFNVDALSFCLTFDHDTTDDPRSTYGQLNMQADDEYDRLRTALQAMPNIRSLSMYKVPSDDQENHKYLYDRVLSNLRSLFPHLTKLAVHTDAHSLNFLRSLDTIERFQFTGFAASTPMETLRALSNLRHLKEIEIIPGMRPSQGQLQAYSASSRQPALSPCLTREVLRGLRFQGLSIRESRAMCPNAPLFFTTEFLQAVYSISRHMLTRFAVTLEDFAPNPAELRLFCEFLSHSHIQHLVVEWMSGTSIERIIIDSLPSSLASLRLGRFTGQEQVTLLFDKLWTMKTQGGLSNLREVTISMETSQDEEDLIYEFNKASLASDEWVSACI